MTTAAGTVAQNIIYEGLLLLVVSIMMKKSLLLKKTYPDQGKECKTHTLFMTKVDELTHTLLGFTYLHGPYKTVHPHPPVGVCHQGIVS